MEREKSKKKIIRLTSELIYVESTIDECALPAFYDLDDIDDEDSILMHHLILTMRLIHNYIIKKGENDVSQNDEEKD